MTKLHPVSLMTAAGLLSLVACGEDVQGIAQPPTIEVEDVNPGPPNGTTDPRPVRDLGPPNTTPPVWDGTRFVQDGETFRIRGVCWNPVPKGADQEDGRDFAGFVDQDAALMASVGINAVRTYTPITDQAVLDTLLANGIFVLQQVYIAESVALDDIDAAINATKDHPAILAWEVGNEWNYNNLYSGLTDEETLDLLVAAVARVKSLDTEHPVTTVYGELPDRPTLDALADVDIWGLNVYRGLTFAGLFDQWEGLSGAPFYMAEYGADAYDATQNGPNVGAQALATLTLTRAIRDSNAIGGTIFEFADEWWKDESGSDDVQDTGGIAPGGGPHPDATFNEEWWGLVDIDRNVRPALDAFAQAWFD
ncbi:MAG: glycoside hydrolase family 2 TIM barrel-domain containing protein [Myxococcota bacterium]